MTYCAPNTAAGVDTLPDGRILVAGMAPCLGLMDARGEPIWTVASPILDFRGQTDDMRVSEDGRVVDFGYGDPGACRPEIRRAVAHVVEPAAERRSDVCAEPRRPDD